MHSFFFILFEDDPSWQKILFHENVFFSSSSSALQDQNQVFQKNTCLHKKKHFARPITRSITIALFILACGKVNFQVEKKNI